MQIGNRTPWTQMWNVAQAAPYGEKKGPEDTESIKNPQSVGESDEKGGKREKKEAAKDPLEDPAVRQQIAKLQARDTEVRAHEAAHMAAGSGVVSGGPSYTYQRGPDGKMYAVGGEVPISVPSSDDPKETVTLMRQVAAAALAPANPSPQDYAVAADARAKEMQAMQELRKEQAEQLKEKGLQTYGADTENRKKEEAIPALDLTV